MKYSFLQEQYLLSLLPKQCGMCNKLLTRKDLTSGNIIANITSNFSILVCTDHFYIETENDIEKTKNFDDSTKHFAFLTAVEMHRATDNLRGHEPERLIDGEIQCQKCGKKYKNFTLLSLIRCTGKFK